MHSVIMFAYVTFLIFVWNEELLGWRPDLSIGSEWGPGYVTRGKAWIPDTQANTPRGLQGPLICANQLQLEVQNCVLAVHEASGFLGPKVI